MRLALTIITFLIVSCQLLLDAGAKVSVEDGEGNTPLHVKCYGEAGLESELGAIQLLLDQGAALTCRNNRVGTGNISLAV